MNKTALLLLFTTATVFAKSDWQPIDWQLPDGTTLATFIDTASIVHDGAITHVWVKDTTTYQLAINCSKRLIDGTSVPPESWRSAVLDVTCKRQPK